VSPVDRLLEFSHLSYASVLNRLQGVTKQAKVLERDDRAEGPLLSRRPAAGRNLFRLTGREHHCGGDGSETGCHLIEKPSPLPELQSGEARRAISHAFDTPIQLCPVRTLRCGEQSHIASLRLARLSRWCVLKTGPGLRVEVPSG